MLYCPKTLVEVQLVRDWVRRRLDNGEDFPDGYAVAIVKPLEDGDAIIRAAMIFSNYNGTNVFVSGASDTNGFMSPTEVAQVLAIPFMPPMSVLRMTALVSETNKRSQRLMKGFGFAHEGTLRDFERVGTNSLVYGLTKADFFGGRYGKRAQATVARYQSNWNDDLSRGQPIRRDVRGHHEWDVGDASRVERSTGGRSSAGSLQPN